MSGQFNINPALKTRWYTISNGVRYRMKVVGTFFTGVGDQFRVTAYELKYDHKNDEQVISAERFLKLIEDKVVRPDYSEDGILTEE